MISIHECVLTHSWSWFFFSFNFFLKLVINVAPKLKSVCHTEKHWSPDQSQDTAFWYHCNTIYNQSVIMALGRVRVCVAGECDEPALGHLQCQSSCDWKTEWSEKAHTVQLPASRFPKSETDGVSSPTPLLPPQPCRPHLFAFVILLSLSLPSSSWILSNYDKQDMKTRISMERKRIFSAKLNR